MLMSRIGLSAASIVATLILSIVPLKAADEAPIVHSGQAYNRPVYCGPCGCLHVTYVRHREIRSTYGLGFDPRNYDQTQPRFYFGPLRLYAHYWADGDLVGAPRC
jgi:hypothetical protein